MDFLAIQSYEVDDKYIPSTFTPRFSSLAATFEKANTYVYAGRLIRNWAVRGSTPSAPPLISKIYSQRRRRLFLPPPQLPLVCCSQPHGAWAIFAHNCAPNWSNGSGLVFQLPLSRAWRATWNVHQ